MDTINHAYECWIPRDGKCRNNCTCQCHTRIYKVVIGGATADFIGDQTVDSIEEEASMVGEMILERATPIVFFVSGHDYASKFEGHPDITITDVTGTAWKI